MPNTQSQKPNSQSGAHDTHEIVPEVRGRTEGSQADCFVNHRSGFDPQGRLGGEKTKGEGEQAPAGPADPVPTVSLADRLYVAIAHRSYQGIGQFIINAAQSRDCGCMAIAYDEEAFVAACERYAASLGGDA